MGCNCGGGAKHREVRTTSGGVPFTASSGVLYRHWSGPQPGEGSQSNYTDVDQAREAVRVLNGGTVEKVDLATGKRLDCPECTT